MEKNKAIELCRFYKGNDETIPSHLNATQRLFYGLEQTWVKWDCDTPVEDDGNVLEFIVDFPDEIPYIDIPLSLKGTMYNQYLHWGRSKELFPDFLTAYIKA